MNGSRFVWILVLLLAMGAAAVRAVPATAQEVERLTREIAANQEGWIETGISLAEGETAEISVLGRASWDANRNFVGPEGTLIEWCTPIAPGLPIGSVLVRVGEGAPVLANGVAVQGPGHILIGYNDCIGAYFDNLGSFSISLHVTRLPPPPAITPAAPIPEPERSVSFLPGLARLILKLVIALAVLAVATGVGFAAWRIIAARIPRFDPSARLESSAWIAPVRLRELQGERLPKRTLSVGGPDADVDFGIAGVRARLIATRDGGTRLEKAGDGESILVNGQPLLLAQRLGTGSRVKIGSREFVYFEERSPRDRAVPGRGRGSGLDRPDPRAAA